MSAWLAELARIGDVTFQAPGRIWFGAPLFLVLLLAPLLGRVRARRALVPLALRAGILGALLAVLLEPAVVERETRSGTLLVLADASPSVGDAGRDEAVRWLSRARDPFDLVRFGASASLVAEQTRTVALDADPRDATDIAAALRLAAARQGGAPLRVVLVSDGRATTPGAVEAALRLRQRGVDLLAVAVPDRPAPAPIDLAVRGIDLPPPERRRGPFDVTAQVEAAAATRATATLLVDGASRRIEEVTLERGRNDVTFRDVALEPGRYHLQVLVAPDPAPGDSVRGALVEVPGIPRVLLLAAAERRSLVADALATQGIGAETRAARAEHDLAAFDAVVLLPDASAADLARHAPALSDFLGRRGGGLLAFGGTEGDGLARLHGSPLAFLLPLDVPPRARPTPPPPPEPEPTRRPRIEIVDEEKEAYPITLCLVVDRSGSMRGPKLTRAKSAAGAAAAALTPQDRLAIIAFGDGADIVLAPRAAGDVGAVARALLPLTAEGRTSMFSALRLAFLVQRRERSAIRHVVLLSDGKPSDDGPWRDLIAAMANENVTLSTVGIGFDVDRYILSQFAQWGRGRFWSANHPHQIPQVVTQDTLHVVKARDRRGEDAQRARPPDEPEPPAESEPPPPDRPDPPAPATVPIVGEPGAPREMLLGLADAELPEVAGVEAGRPRFGSWTAARAGAEGPPLLAYWRVGLGTAAAFAADPEAPACKGLREHTEFPRLMAQLLRSVLPDSRGEPYVVRHALEVTGAEERLVLQVVGEDGLPRTDLPLELRVDGRLLEPWRRAERYEAVLPFRAEVTRGAARVGGGETGPVLERAFVLPPSRNPERAATGPDRAALLRLVGDPARLDPTPSRALRAPEEVREHRRPLWLPFLLLAAILLPLDAWARRRARSASQ